MVDWFNFDWNYRVKVTVQNSKVDVNLTDFPVYVDLSDLPAGFFTNVKNDGSDIRVTQADGTTEQAREIVTITTGSSIGEIHFKASSLSSSTDTDFYIYYGNAGASEPAEDATYGRENTWNSDYIAVWHLQESADGTVDEYLDSTSNDNDGTGGDGNSPNTPVQIDGKIAKGQDFIDSPSFDFIKVPDSASLVFSSGFTFSAWVWPDEVPGSANDLGDFIMSKNNAFAGNQMEFEWGWTDSVRPGVQWYSNAFDFGVANTYPTAGQWNHMVATFDGTDVDYFLDGSADGGYTPFNNPPPNTVYDLNIGGIRPRSTGYDFEGKLDEIRIQSGEVSATFISTEHNNQNSPSTFYAVGNQESSGEILTKTFDADAFIKGILTKTFDADALIKGALTKTFEVDSRLVNVRTKTFTIDSEILKQFTLVKLDAIVRTPGNLLARQLTKTNLTAENKTAPNIIAFMEAAS